MSEMKKSQKIPMMDEASMTTIRRRRERGLARRRQQQHVQREREVVDHNTGSIKLSIPSFQGKNDPDAYIE